MTLRHGNFVGPEYHTCEIEHEQNRGSEEKYDGGGMDESKIREKISTSLGWEKIAAPLG